MGRWMGTSIVFRSAAIVLGIALLVGTLFSVLANTYTMRSERERVTTRMSELLNTVENTASIACFLQDKNLASEVSLGLLKNHFIRGVVITSGHQVLARAGASGKAAPSAFGTLLRDVVSPFNRNEIVCRIALDPDDAVIQQTIVERSRFVVALLLIQTLVVACAVVLMVMALITRPIKHISDSLHRLPVGTGARLSLPAGHRRDEIGRLVDDVNTLVAKLVRIVDDERTLRMQREIDEKKYRAIFENAGTGIFVADRRGTLLSYNRAFMRALGIAEQSALPMARQLLPAHLGPYGQRSRELIGMALAENRPVAEDFRLECGHGLPAKWINLVLSPIEDGMVQGLLNDISERKDVEERAQLLAATDPLTGIANRLGLDNKLAQLGCGGAADEAVSFFLMLIDLDHFKAVNDTHGHDAGDLVLRHFVVLLAQLVRKDDFIGRLGGDEFVVVLTARRIDIVARIAQQIIAAVAQPIAIGNGQQVTIGASIGIAMADPQINKDEVMKRADDAMYLCKQRGRNCFHIYGAANTAAQAACPAVEAAQQNVMPH